jgi:hypothetical protein
MTIIRELIAKIGFDVDSTKLDKFDKSVDQLKSNLNDLSKKAKMAIGVITAATGAITALSLSTARAVQTTSELSTQIGVSADDLRTLEFAAQGAGLKTDALTNSLLRFSTMLGQAKISRKGTSNEFKALGIDIQNANGQTKDTISLYREAALKLNSMNDQAKKSAISYRLFGTANVDLTKFLTQSNESLVNQLNSVRALTYEIDDNAINASKKFIKSWTDAKTIFTSVKDEISLRFMPVLDELLGGFKDWFIVNKDLIKQNIDRTVSGIATTFKFLYNAVSIILTPVTKFVEMVGGLENALKILSATLAIRFIPKVLLAASALKGLSFASAISSAGLLTKAIGGVGAVLLAFVADDLTNWVEGNESAIGKVLGDWEKFKTDFISIMTKGFEQISTVAKDYGNSIYESLIGKPSTAIKGLFQDDNIQRTRHFKTPITKDNQPKVMRRKGAIQLADESNLEDELSIRTIAKDNKPAASVRRQRPISLYDESQLNKPERPININSEKVQIIDPKAHNVANNTRMDFNPAPNINNNSSNSSVNNVTQNINQSMTINVPSGTTQEQSKAISHQVANEVSRQFETVFLNGINSIPAR